MSITHGYSRAAGSIHSLMSKRESGYVDRMTAAAAITSPGAQAEPNPEQAVGLPQMEEETHDLFDRHSAR